MSKQPIEEPIVNAEGTKWWREKSLEDWANKGDTQLSDHGYRFWRIETTDGYRAFLATVDDAVVYSSTSSEAVAVRIDIWRMYAKEERGGK